MSRESSSKLTELLAEVAEGKEGAQQELFERVYQELHAMASRLMHRERPGHTWGASDLLHEAYLHLFQGTAPTKNRRYFFGAAARAMRQLLARIPGPPLARTPLEDLLSYLQQTQQVDMSELNRALDEFEGVAPREHEVVMLKIFGGMRIREIAECQGVSLSTVEADWRWWCAWLYTRLEGDNHAP